MCGAKRHPFLREIADFCIGFADFTLKIVHDIVPANKAKDYLKHVAEHVEPWSCLKFPYLKAVGWKGIVEGVEAAVEAGVEELRERFDAAISE